MKYYLYKMDGFTAEPIIYVVKLTKKINKDEYLGEILFVKNNVGNWNLNKPYLIQYVKHSRTTLKRSNILEDIYSAYNLEIL